MYTLRRMAIEINKQHISALEAQREADKRATSRAVREVFEREGRRLVTHLKLLNEIEQRDGTLTSALLKDLIRRTYKELNREQRYNMTTIIAAVIDEVKALKHSDIVRAYDFVTQAKTVP